MRKLKLLLAACALFVGVSSVSAQPTASTPVVGNTYYLYNPTTKLFMTTNVELPFVRPTGSAWKLENGAQDGYITLRLKDNTTDGCGYFWGKWWANNPAQNSNDYSSEREYKLVNTSGDNYKLQSYAWGATTAFIYINNGNEGDRSYRLACNSQDQGGLDEGFMTWQFISEEDYANYMSNDYTSSIVNNDFLSGTANWTLEGTGNKQTHGNTAIEYWNKFAASGSFDYYQNITVPAGKYVLRAAMYNSTNGEEGASFDAAGQCGVYGTSGGETKNANVTIDGTAYNIYTTDALLVADGNLRLGFKNSTTMTARWFGVDWIQLTCEEYCISAIATEIPAAKATTLTADKWYKFTAASTGDYDFDATTAVGDIVYCSTDQLLSEVTGITTATATVALTKGTTYYIKSSSAQTLTISPKNFTYTVGEATADMSYIQEDNTVTVTYASFGTDNPSPTEVIDFSGVTFGGNAISVTPIANGFTFAVPEVTANTPYTLAIPANAIGYSDGEGTYNAAQEITLTTPAIFDGTYYLYDETNKLFLSRGKNNGSRAVVDLYGLPFNLVTDGNGASQITFKDWNDKYMYFDKDDHASCWLYTNGGNNSNSLFAFEATTGGYYLRDAAKAVYIKHDNSVLNVPTTTEGEATVWTIKSKAERDAIVNAYPTTNKSNVITAAGISTTAAEFESYLTTNYAAKDKTSLVGTAKFTGDKGDWTWTSVSGNPAYGTDWTEGFQVAGTWSQTINGLTPGIYKVTVNGFERKAGYALCNTLGAEGYEPVTAYFKANNEQLPLKSWYSDKTGTNDPDNVSQAATAFNNDKYKNTIYTYVADGGEGTGSLTLTIGKQDIASGSWVLFNNVTLTYFDGTISDEDATAIIDDAATEMAKPMKPSLYQALSTAKSTFEGSKIVPNYNALRTAIDNTETSVASYAAMNTNYLTPIAAILTSSNIVDLGSAAYTDYVAYKAKYDNYKDALTEDIENATANSLNIWQGSGARYTNIANILMTTGWKINGTDALTDGSGFYANTWSTENDGTAPAKDFSRPFYEMWVGSGSIPAATLTRVITGLTANVVYKVTANVRVQGDGKVAGSITMKAGDGETVDVTAGNKIAETPRYINSYTALGKADASGNLTLTFTVAESSGISWLAFRDVNYETAAAENITISEDADYTPEVKYANVTLTRTFSATNWNTFVVPFDIDNATLAAKLGTVEVAEYSETSADADNATVNFNKMASPAITANKPVLLKTSTAPASVTFDGVVVKTGAAKVAGSNFDFVGSYAASKEIEAGDYYISANKLYNSTGLGSTIKGTRAYITTHTDGARIVNFSIDGVETTGIEGLEAAQTENGKIYNLAGQEVKKAQKGLYIQNGKKMVVR